MSQVARGMVAIFVLSALFGAVFAGVSTYDFVQHLDRQVHGAHCSFIPGLGGDDPGSSGCDVALMSPYSSVFRTWIWGGLPIALPGLALFVFMACRGAAMSFASDHQLRGAAFVLTGWSFIASVTSIIMGSIAFFELETLCKSCIGIYIASFVCFGSAVMIMLAAWDADPPESRLYGDTDHDEDNPLPIPSAMLAVIEHSAWLVAGSLFVLAPCILYFLLTPDFTSYIGTCGGLEEREDRYGILIPLHPTPGGIETIEVFDPLCPACKALEDRLSLSGHGGRLDRKLVLFPLDSTCNWMIGDAIHPGACATSEAVLCAKDPAAVVEYAFANQEAIMELAKESGEKALYAKLERDLPEVAGCVGTAKARQRLNRSLRWAVSNSLRVLTPQLFIDGVAVCEEDTDIGLTYVLDEMLDRADAKTLAIQETP